MQQAIKNYLSKHGFERFLPKAALFDMDGVLYDSMPNHAVAWHDSMEKFGIHMTAYDAYATEGARGIDTIRKMVKEQKGEDISLEKAQEMYDLKTKFFHGMKEPDIMPGVRELMQKMHERGMLIGVVTGSGQRPLINRLLNDFHEFVDESRLVTAYDVRRHLQPWEGMVIENAPLGVRAGVAARIFTVAVNSGPLPDSALTDEGADLIFSNMTDFLKVFSTL